MSTSSHIRPSIANRKIPETFTLRRATRYGGFNGLSDFVRGQGIDHALEAAFGEAKAPWATYSLPESLRHLLDGSLLGLERIWHFEELEQEPLLCVKRGREQMIRRALATQGWYVLDCDSTVETLYGEQEGARLGPNPHKPGRPSYHPLLCRERKSGLVVNSRLRRATRGPRRALWASSTRAWRDCRGASGARSSSAPIGTSTTRRSTPAASGAGGTMW